MAWRRRCCDEKGFAIARKVGGCGGMKVDVGIGDGSEIHVGGKGWGGVAEWSFGRASEGFFDGKGEGFVFEELLGI